MTRALGMWPRTTEVLIGTWLLAGPWLLDAPIKLAIHDTVIGAVAVALSILCLLDSRRRLHLWHLLIGSWLAVLALLITRNIHDATGQSQLLSGLGLVMFGLIPSRVLEIPGEWTAFYARHPDAAKREAEALTDRGSRA